MLVVHNGEEQERLMRCAMVVEPRDTGPCLCQSGGERTSEVLLKHCLRPPSVFIGQLETL